MSKKTRLMINNKGSDSVICPNCNKNYNDEFKFCPFCLVKEIIYDKEGYLSTHQKNELIDKLYNCDLESEDAMEKFDDLKELIFDIERDNEIVDEIARKILERTKFDIWDYDCKGIMFWSPDEEVTFSYTLLLDLHEAFKH